METIKDSLIRERTTPEEGKLTIFKKIRARICHNCRFVTMPGKIRNPESEEFFTTDIMRKTVPSGRLRKRFMVKEM